MKSKPELSRLTLSIGKITTQNLTVVQLIENDNLILVEGSVPGSKNGIVMLKDALKSEIPEAAPFPAGLHSKDEASISKVDDAITVHKDIDENSEKNGDQVEN